MALSRVPQRQRDSTRTGIRHSAQLISWLIRCAAFGKPMAQARPSRIVGRSKTTTR
jgi:hypothetical protein